MLKRWIKTIGIACIFIVIGLLLIGSLYQFVSTKMEDHQFPPLGKMVDVGGYHLHINPKGQGGPTVILDAGMGCNSLDWSLVQPEIAKFTRVCSYDRAGNGWSDVSPLERTSQNIVDELHTLLKNSGEKGPYILVGHSFGGVNVRLYASNYPDEVLGVVLVDSSHENQFEKLPELQLSFFEKFFMYPHVGPFLASIGLIRILNHSSEFHESYKGFSTSIKQMYLAKQSTTQFFSTITKEISLFQKSLKQLKDAGGILGDKPLIVISAGKSLRKKEMAYPEVIADKVSNVWELLQKDLVTKSTRGRQIIAEHSGHMIIHEQPGIIVRAIHELVKGNN